MKIFSINELNEAKKIFIEVSVSTAKTAQDIIDDSYKKNVSIEDSNYFVIKKADIAEDILKDFKRHKVEILDHNIPDVNEGRKQVKRKYTENYPRIRVNSNTKHRNHVLSYVAENEPISLESLKKYIGEYDNDGEKVSNTWLNQNQRFFHEFMQNGEKHIKLTKLGRRTFDSCNFNEHQNSLTMKMLSINEWKEVREAQDDLKSIYVNKKDMDAAYDVIYDGGIPNNAYSQFSTTGQFYFKKEADADKARKLLADAKIKILNESKNKKMTFEEFKKGKKKFMEEMMGDSDCEDYNEMEDFDGMEEEDVYNAYDEYKKAKNEAFKKNKKKIVKEMADDEDFKDFNEGDEEDMEDDELADMYEKYKKVKKK